MSIPIGCYNNIIGLSSTDCTCYETGKPDDWNVSESGLYLDELEPLDKLTGSANCENGSVWDAMEKARDNAIMRFISDSNARLITDNKLKRNTFKGGIGRPRNTANFTVQSTYAGLRIYCSDIISGFMKITQIGTIFDDTGTFTMYIYNNLNELVQTIPGINSVAGTFTLNTVNIELPMHSEYVSNLEYYLLYVYDSTNKPRNNDLCCECGAGFQYIINKPYFNKRQSQRYGWANYIMVGGYETNVLDFYDVCNTGTNQLYGLTLNTEFYCRVGDVLCKNSYDMNYTQNPIAASIAHAILFKSGEIMLRSLLKSTNLNRPAIIDRETMEKFISDYTLKYEKYMNYIIDTADLTKTDCLECRETFNIRTIGILS